MRSPGWAGMWLAAQFGFKNGGHRFCFFFMAFCILTTSMESPAEKKGIHMHSDALFGPPGSRGYQGLMAMYSGALIQWESKQQPFGTLSSSEAELMGYTDALMGESCATIAAILENGDGNKAVDCVLHGDSQSGIRILQSPDGPWRTRHLRLRALCGREISRWLLASKA